MLALLERLVNSDSPSRDRIAVDMTGMVLKQFFSDYRIPVTVRPHAEYGEAIYACIPQPAAANQRPILLLGHRIRCSRWRGSPPAVSHRTRPRLRARHS